MAYRRVCSSSQGHIPFRVRALYPPADLRIKCPFFGSGFILPGDVPILQMIIPLLVAMAASAINRIHIRSSSGSRNISAPVF
jgi:hypothetical protein